MAENKEEFLEIWDWETGCPTGKSVERKFAHDNGIAHEGVHLWIMRTENNICEILFQKRAENKDQFPGYLDITVGGHVPFGLAENKIQKEAFEEIGIMPDNEKMIDLGFYRYEEKLENLFHREFQHIYLLHDNRKLSEYKFNDGEVSAILSIKLADFEKILIEDIVIQAEIFDGEKTYKTTIGKDDIHPLLFAPSMEEYTRIVIDAVKKEFDSFRKYNL
jgi:isopentenyldiphosphate isomerase